MWNVAEIMFSSFAIFHYWIIKEHVKNSLLTVVAVERGEFRSSQKLENPTIAASLRSSHNFFFLSSLQFAEAP